MQKWCPEINVFEERIIEVLSLAEPGSNLLRGSRRLGGELVRVS